MVVINVGLSENFESFYENIKLGQDSLITLRDAQNRVMVRYPLKPELLGKPVAGPATNWIVDAGTGEGIYRAKSPVDGIDRIMAIRKLPEQPLYALVGIAADDALALWRTEALAALGVAIASLLVGSFLAATMIARLRAEEELRELNTGLEARVAERTASLEQAVGDLEAFSYSASHDLRAPLRAINGYARILIDTEREKLEDESKGMLDRIATNAEKMGHLIDDTLDYSRAGFQHMERSTVDLGALAADVAEDLRDAYPKTEILIDKFPAAVGDEKMLRQILQNLIENACKFSAKQESPRVEIGVRDAHGIAEYFVRDNGVGFDPRYAQ
jgi:signal transduction histidine kinase